MLSWFRAQCPVEPEVKAWVEQRMTWLVGQFGWERLAQGKVILANEDYFPDPYDASNAGARTLLDRVCEYLDIDPASVDLELYSERQPISFNIALEGYGEGTAGLYSEEEQRTKIWLESSRLTDPMSVVATFAHELCHAHLLGGGRISRETEDHEPLTDLATVYFGMGIFTANASLRTRSYHWGGWESWSVSRQGYLVAPVLGYALALFAWLRQDRDATWASCLRLDVRSPFKKALAYLVDTGSDVLESMEAASSQPRACPAELLPHSRRQEEHDEARPEVAADEEGGAGESPDDPPADSIDDAFTQGAMHAHRGEWEAAAREFSAVIQGNGDDGEAFQQRALARLWLGSLAEALADAERAVRLLPDDSECHRVRGMVHLYSRQYSQAIADFDLFLDEEEGISRYPEPLATVRHLRGMARAADGDLRGAIADYARAIDLWPQWPAPYRARAEAYERLGQKEEAAADREEAAWRNENHGEGTTLP